MQYFNETGYDAIPLISVIKFDADETLKLAHDNNIVPKYVNKEDIKSFPEMMNIVNEFICSNI